MGHIFFQSEIVREAITIYIHCIAHSIENLSHFKGSTLWRSHSYICVLYTVPFLSSFSLSLTLYLTSPICSRPPSYHTLFLFIFCLVSVTKMQYNNMYKIEHNFLNRSFLSNRTFDYYLQDIA